MKHGKISGFAPPCRNTRALAEPNLQTTLKNCDGWRFFDVETLATKKVSIVLCPFLKFNGDKRQNKE
jgi:hypothetical protein